MRAAFVDVDGIRTRYLYEGDGPPLLLAHGLGISADCWARNIDVLAKHFSVFAPDLFGHGFTQFRDLGGRAGHAAILEHYMAWVDTLGIDEYYAAGSSYGAGISSLFYLERPEAMKKLIIVGASSVFRPSSDQQQGFSKSYENATSALRHPTFETCRKRLGNVCYDESSVDDAFMLVQLTSYAQEYILPAYEAIAQANMNLEVSAPYRVVDKLEQIELPTLIITGRDDVRAPLQNAIDGQMRIPNSDISIFDKCGHMPMMEHPAQFNETVIEFLQRD